VYLLLGCGDVGFALARELKEREVELIIIDQSAAKVEQLKGLGYNSLVGDFSLPEVLRQAQIDRAEVVLILISNSRAVERTLGAINRLKLELGIDPIIVARVLDEKEVPGIKKLGATEALPSSEILANLTLKRFNELRVMAKEKKLRALLGELRGKMAILLQTNPDPDGIASGLAFQRYVKESGMDADIIYDGQIGHQQNRALVNLLNIELLHAKRNRVKFEKYDSFALVDVATTTNCALPKDIEPTIVIDHHSVPSGEVKGKYQDIAAVGATATILANYLKYAGIEIDGPIATALALGILTDTMSFTREATELDFATFEELLPSVDKELLGRLRSPAISPDTLSVLARAIKSSKLKGGYLYTNVGFIKDRDAIPQAADFLLNREGVMTVLVYGIGKDTVYVSARTNDIRLHIGQVLKSAFGDIGSAGGHSTMAGASIPLKAFGKDIDKKALKGAVDQAIGRKFLEVVGVVKPKPKR
jgi:nanoRNase/pAp phosphatase (c-di-AMP/oligoRNAs hydrolase)